MYGQFVREMPETMDEKESQTEVMLCAVQEQVIQTNYVKHKIN